MMQNLLLAIALLACFLLPFAGPAETANSMDSQNEMNALKAQVEKLTAQVEMLTALGEKFMAKIENTSRKFADQFDDKSNAVDIVDKQLGVINVYGNSVKFPLPEGHGLKIWDDHGTNILHIGGQSEILKVRANLPIPFKRNAQTSYIAFYYEVELITAVPNTIRPFIGFCSGSFSLKRGTMGLGWADSIGMIGKRFVRIMSHEHEFAFAPPWGQFNEGDVVGIGLLHSPAAGGKLTIFASANSKYMGSVNLPSSFLNDDLFPAIELNRQGERVIVNFGKIPWQFDPLRLLPNE